MNLSLFEIESPRAQTYLELANCAIRSIIVDNVLMRFANISLFMETEKIDQTTYYVVSAWETIGENSKMLVYSFTPSVEELGMDLQEFLDDYMSESANDDEGDEW